MAIAAATTGVILCPLAMPMANADTTEVSIMGTGGFGSSLEGILGGWVDNQYGIDDYIKNPYPASAYVFGLAGPSMDDSTNEAQANLTQLIADTSGRIVVAGLSQGAIGATKALNDYLSELSGTSAGTGAPADGATALAATTAAPAAAPSPDAVSFVLIGNPSRKGTGIAGQNPGFYNPIFGLTYIATPDNTPYHVDDIAREYDGFADGVYDVHDLPSLLACINSLAGILVIHPFYDDVNVTDPSTLVKEVGNTTYYLIPTERLPMLAGWYALGDMLGSDHEVLDQINVALKAEIDKAYDRSGYQTVGSLSEDPTARPALAEESLLTLDLDQKRLSIRRLSSDEPAPRRDGANAVVDGASRTAESPTVESQPAAADPAADPAADTESIDREPGRQDGKWHKGMHRATESSVDSGGTSTAKHRWAKAGGGGRHATAAAADDAAGSVTADHGGKKPKSGGKHRASNHKSGKNSHN